jgi:hypothetical protein
MKEDRMTTPLFRRSLCTLAATIAGAEAVPCDAQGYTVGGSRPSQNTKLKLHAELATSDNKHVVALPKLGLALPTSPSLELGIDAHLRHLDRNDAERMSGIGDVEFKAKCLLLDGRRNAARIDMSAELKVSIPTGDAARGLGDGQPAVKLPITFSHRRGPWEFGGLVGAQFVYRRDKATLLAGALVTRTLGKEIKVGAEVATEMRYKNPGTQEIMANIGFRYQPNPRTEFFVIAGRSLEARDGRPVAKFKLGLEIALD